MRWVFRQPVRIHLQHRNPRRRVEYRRLRYSGAAIQSKTTRVGSRMTRPGNRYEATEYPQYRIPGTVGRIPAAQVFRCGYPKQDYPSRVSSDSPPSDRPSARNEATEYPHHRYPRGKHLEEYRRRRYSGAAAVVTTQSKTT